MKRRLIWWLGLAGLVAFFGWLFNLLANDPGASGCEPGGGYHG